MPEAQWPIPTFPEGVCGFAVWEGAVSPGLLKGRGGDKPGERCVGKAQPSKDSEKINDTGERGSFPRGSSHLCLKKSTCTSDLACLHIISSSIIIH